MFEMLITERVHHCLSLYINKGDTVIDATMGNGNDTVYLAERVGNEGKVIAFDIQKKAIENTVKKLIETNASKADQIHCIDSAENIPNEKGIVLINQSHEKMNILLNHSRIQEEKLSCVMFNFGYLPSGDKTITTQVDSSLKAIDASLELIKEKGVISLVTYPGHHEGFLEDQAIDKRCRCLSSKHFEVIKLNYVNRSEKAPKQYLIYKRCCQ